MPVAAEGKFSVWNVAWQVIIFPDILFHLSHKLKI